MHSAVAEPANGIWSRSRRGALRGERNCPTGRWTIARRRSPINARRVNLPDSTFACQPDCNITVTWPLCDLERRLPGPGSPPPSIEETGAGVAAIVNGVAIPPGLANTSAE